MIILDTNIISELMKASPTETVMHWINQQPSMDLFITSVTVAEISYGLQTLPTGQRRILLEKAFTQAYSTAFRNRVLAFDEAAAHRYGQLMAKRKSLGKPLGVPDGQIAAIAQLHGFSLATRNVRDFADCNLAIVNPF